jgi:predicted RNase H-like HicB family nuclease
MLPYANCGCRAQVCKADAIWSTISLNANGNALTVFHSPPYNDEIPEESIMRNEFTAVIERDSDWFIAYCPEIPGANGQGRTIEECRHNLVEAIALILEDRREDGLRGVPTDAIRETVTIG